MAGQLAANSAMGRADLTPVCVGAHPSGRPRPAHQLAGITKPATVLPAPLAATGAASAAAEEDCTVHLEPLTDASEFGSCQHRFCQGCLLLLRQAGILQCPLCRSPASELNPPLPPQVPGYVVL